MGVGCEQFASLFVYPVTLLPPDRNLLVGAILWLSISVQTYMSIATVEMLPIMMINKQSHRQKVLFLGIASVKRVH